MLDPKFKDFDNTIEEDHWILSALSKLEINVKCWNAWSANFTGRQDWINWAHETSKVKALKVPSSYDSLTPSVTFLPLPLRKKLSPVTKVLLSLYQSTIEKSDVSTTRVVFSSRYGEARSTIELLEALGKNEPGSPMAFSRSVHNFGVGLNSIFTENRRPNTAIAGMENSFFAGILESLIQLNTSDDDKVLYIYAEDSNPDVFEKFYKIPIPFGFTFLLAKDPDGCEYSGNGGHLVNRDSSSTENVETDSLQFLKNVIRASS